MTIREFAADVKSRLPYTPNEQQDALIDALARFCAGLSHNSENVTSPDVDRAFIVNGYAGTGKTSLVAALVNALVAVKIPVVCMSPTGRAAKVFSSYAGINASTIHRRIYRHSLHGEVPGLRPNNTADTVYIVDEASMIGDASSGADLLSNLITFVFAGARNRLILIGDTAQLPPVGDTRSPAMDAEALRAYGIRVSRATLTHVARQGARSGILANAVSIRRGMSDEPTKVPVPVTENFDDVDTVTAEDLPEVIDNAYRKVGIDETIIITRSNRRAADFNRAVRAEVLYYEEALVRNEPVMVAKNNYYWTRAAHRKDIDFIANGDIMRVERIVDTETRYGFRFADVELFVSEESESLPAKIFLETLGSDQPALAPERLRQLYEALMRHEYADVADPAAALRADPYWNALQTKYAYAVTCHKAQGGQWAHAIVDIAYINPDTVGIDLYRWFYTATTRATRHLTYLIDQPFGI